MLWRYDCVGKVSVCWGGVKVLGTGSVLSAAMCWGGIIVMGRCKSVGEG